MRDASIPAFARRCPRPWTAIEDDAFEAKLAQIQHDIRSAGGLAEWLETRLDLWITLVGPCRVAPVHRGRRVRR